VYGIELATRIVPGLVDRRDGGCSSPRSAPATLAVRA